MVRVLCVVFTLVSLGCNVSSSHDEGISDQSTVEKCENHRLVCDVEASFDMLTIAEILVGDIDYVDLIFIEYRELEDGRSTEKEVYNTILDVAYFADYDEMGSYVDVDGDEITIYRYTFDNLDTEAINGFFCGEELFPEYRIEWDFWSEEDSYVKEPRSVAWYIILEHQVCRLVCKDE